MYQILHDYWKNRQPFIEIYSCNIDEDHVEVGYVRNPALPCTLMAVSGI